MPLRVPARMSIYLRSALANPGDAGTDGLLFLFRNCRDNVTTANPRGSAWPYSLQMQNLAMASPRLGKHWFLGLALRASGGAASLQVDQSVPGSITTINPESAVAEKNWPSLLLDVSLAAAQTARGLRFSSY